LDGGKDHKAKANHPPIIPMNITHDKEFFDTLFEKLDCRIKRYLKMGLRISSSAGYPAKNVNGYWHPQLDQYGHIAIALPISAMVFKKKAEYRAAALDFAYYWGIDPLYAGPLESGICGYDNYLASSIRHQYSMVGMRIRSNNRRTLVEEKYPHYNPNLKLSDIEV
jgi:hypothetical protein